MSEYYRIRDIPGMSGLIVKVGVHEEVGEYDAYEIVEIVNGNIIIGDSQVKFPISSQSLWISSENLSEVDFSPREWTTDSPFGKLEYEGHRSKGTVHVDYAVYDNGMSVNVKDTSVKPTRTVLSQNYFEDFRVDAEESIEQALRNETDIEDLVFDLQAISAAQREQMKK